MLQATADGWTHLQLAAKRTGLILLLALGGAWACSSGETAEEGGLGPAAGATLSVVIDGLPVGTGASVEVSSAQGYQHNLNASAQLSQLAVGNYLLTAKEIVVGGDRYVPAPESQTVTLSTGATLSVHVAYVLATARMRIVLAGVPAGVTASLSLTGPGGFQQSVTQSTVLAGLLPGSYSLAAPGLIAGGDRYQAESELVPVVLLAPDTIPVTASITYAIASGRLVLQVSGAPAQTSPSVHVTGPGLDRFITPSDTLFGLTPAVYTVQAGSLVSGGATYAPTPGELSISVSADPLPAVAHVAYGLATGALQVTATGLPAGASASINVTGPDGFAATLGGSQLLVGLAPGSYTIAAGSASFQGQLYLPSPGSQSRFVAAGLTPEQVAVSYAAAPASLTLSVAGLPAGAAASLALTGPGGYSVSLTGSQSLSGLAAGTYHLSAAPVSAGGFAYSAQPASQDVTLSGGQSGSLTVSYAPTTGALSVAIAGLPGGVAAAVTVSGPGSYLQNLTASQTLTSLAPGSYTVSATGVSSGGVAYGAQPASQGISISGGQTGSLSVSYAPLTGALSVAIGGLPGGVAAAVTVSGPGGYLQNLSAAQTLSSLAPGSYTVSGAGVSGGGFTYSATPPSQSVTVVAGSTASASLSYSANSGGLDLTINGAYLTQAVQRYDGSVPLVAGRDAYLRVFALANQANSAQPQVRVRLYNGAFLLQTYALSAPAGSVPQASDESSLTKSWNVLVPAALVQPGLRLLADVDPGNGVPETDESNNQFPLSGVAANVDVRALPTFAVRLVPVLQQVNGLQGDVTGANKESFLADLKRMLPVGAYDADIRAPYTTTASALQSNDGNSAWGTVLGELLALRNADASTRYYYGVVKVGYGSGVAGLGYVGGSARTAMGWDYLPSAANVMAHEVGHNMGRSHAPCGGAGSPDPSYPYSGGQIGVWGLDLASLTLKSPTAPDLMGYCGPSWISDYNWSGMVGFRQGGPNNAPEAGSGAAGLLVWGRVGPGGIVLEPAFTVAASPDLLPRPGADRLELLAADGSLLRSVSFATVEVADLPGGSERAFAFVLPLRASEQAAVASLRVSAQGRSATSRPAVASDPTPAVTRINPQQIELRWDATRFPVVLVRDAVSRQVLSFARGGVARIWSRAQDFELQFSNGVRPITRTARVLR